MKTIRILALLLLCGTVTTSNAQFLKKLKNRAKEAAERAVERKVEEKSERETEKAFDSIFNNEGKIFGGKKMAPAESYAFTHSYKMNIIQKSDTTLFTYYLSDTEEILGSEIQLKENERMLTVIDLPRKTAYSFMDFGDMKSTTSFGLDFEKAVENQNDPNVVIEATGNTKDILGYHSEEYNVYGEDFEGTIWVTQEADISFSNAFENTMKKNRSKGVNQNWMSMIEGLTLEMNMTDTSKKKPRKIKMECISVEATDYVIYPSDYKQTF